MSDENVSEIVKFFNISTLSLKSKSAVNAGIVLFLPRFFCHLRCHQNDYFLLLFTILNINDCIKIEIF